METSERLLSPLTSDSSSKFKCESENATSRTVSSPVPPPSSVLRLWRPAAQRNLRNQWSQMASLRQDWVSASSCGRSHATSLVNSYLSQRYMPSMELGVLDDMPDIRKKACYKLFKQQEQHWRRLLSSYKNMVNVVNCMVNTSQSMRCFIKGPSSSPIVQFSSLSEDMNDIGDGGGIPVFTFLSIASFEKLAEELLQMFKCELNLKRMILLELVSISCESPPVDEFCWSDELYPGEFDDLNRCDLYSVETCEPVSPKLRGWDHSDTQLVRPNSQLNDENLQVCLTTWLAEVNIDAHRVNEIFTLIGEEMRVNFL